MPTKLRIEAERYLTLALKAQSEEQAADAHALTRKAADFLEEAIALEELRRKLPAQSTFKEAASVR
jgi:hypothetical protein